MQTARYCLWIALLLTYSLMIGCTSSKKLLKQGNYYEAVLTATDRLKKSPNNNNAQETLRSAYPLAVQYFKEQAHHAKISQDPWQWTITADAYQALNVMYEAIQATPKARQLIGKPLPFYKEYGQVKEKAAAEQFQAGEQSLRLNTREDAKEAFYFFQRANTYAPGYKNASRKMAEAKEKATLKVVMEFVPVPSRFYKVSADFFYNQVATYLKNQNRQFEFISFYTAQEARNARITHPDQIIRLQFEDFVVGQTNTYRNTETVSSKDSVKVGEVTLDDGKKRPVYEIVTAKLTTTRVELKSAGLLSMEVSDSQARGVIHHDEMTGEFIWIDQWASFQGDERALTAEEKALCKRRASPAPPPQDLFVQFTKPIYEQLTARINRFYRQYA